MTTWGLVPLESEQSSHDDKGLVPLIPRAAERTSDAFSPTPRGVPTSHLSAKSSNHEYVHA